MIDNPARRQFIEQRIINTPMPDDEYDYWLDLFQQWEERVDGGTETDQGREHWVGFMRRRINAGDVTPEQVARALRSKYLTDLWDQEHREPMAHDAIYRHTGKAKPPYFRDTGNE